MVVASILIKNLVTSGIQKRQESVCINLEHEKFTKNLTFYILFSHLCRAMNELVAIIINLDYFFFILFFIFFSEHRKIFKVCLVIFQYYE